jgi:RNA polymerase sigma factor FliA
VSEAEDRSPSSSLVADVDERRLWLDLRERDSVAARERLFSIYSPFAKRIARKHFLDRTSGDIEFPDLCQLAFAGLLEAIDRFDVTLGASFKTYATRRISGSILDGVAKTSEVRSQISFRNRIRAERARSLLRPEDVDGGTANDALRALSELAVGLALGFMLEGTGLYASDDQPHHAPNAYESLAWKETITSMFSEVGSLAKREQDIIRYHYIEGLTFEQIGALLGVTKGRVSQVHKGALEQLRRRLIDRPGFELER